VLFVHSVLLKLGFRLGPDLVILSVAPLLARDTKAGAPSRVVMDFQGDDVFNQEDVDGIVKNSITSVLTDAM
jgi:hypothetical protein